MPTTSLPSSIIFDKSATTDVSTVTPSLSNLRLATEIYNYANSGGGSVQTVGLSSSSAASSSQDSSDSKSSSQVTGLVYASESSDLEHATGSFAASSDVKTLSISSSSDAAASTSSGSKSSSGGSLDSSENGASEVVGSTKGAKYLLVFSLFTVASMAVSL